MLNLPVGIEELGANDPDFRALRVLQHGIEPVVLDALDVVVEKKQVLTYGMFSRLVVEA